jgi:hypothetical protein
MWLLVVERMHCQHPDRIEFLLDFEEYDSGKPFPLQEVP